MFKRNSIAVNLPISKEYYEGSQKVSPALFSQLRAVASETVCRHSPYVDAQGAQYKLIIDHREVQRQVARWLC